MKNEDLSKLVASIKEAGEIKAGKGKPSRGYHLDPPTIKAVREKKNALKLFDR